MTAAHIFPYGAGQAMMDNFFGREHEDKPGMFEIENGMIMSTAAEKKKLFWPDGASAGGTRGCV